MNVHFAEPDAPTETPLPAEDTDSAADPAAPLLAADLLSRQRVARRAMPELPIEAWMKRIVFLATALLITLAYAWSLSVYWSPVHLGTDQNGYLVGGKMFAENLTMEQTPVQLRRPDLFDPHAFVSTCG